MSLAVISQHCFSADFIPIWKMGRKTGCFLEGGGAGTLIAWQSIL